MKGINCSQGKLSKVRGKRLLKNQAEDVQQFSLFLFLLPCKVLSTPCFGFDKSTSKGLLSKLSITSQTQKALCKVGINTADNVCAHTDLGTTYTGECGNAYQICRKLKNKMSRNGRKKQLKMSRKECHVPYSFVRRMVVFCI